MQNPKMKKLNVKFNGKAVVVASWKSKKFFTRDEIKKIATEYSQSLAKKKFKGEISVSINFGNELGWKQAKGEWDKPGGRINLFKPQDYEDDAYDDPEEYKEFKIYLKKK